MICLRVKRVTVSVWICAAPVCNLTSSRTDARTAFGSVRLLVSRAGMADRVSRRDAASTVSVPRAAMAALTAALAPNRSVVVASSCATSDCSCSSGAPYSELPNPPNSPVSPSTVTSVARRSPWAIWWLCSTPSEFHTAAAESSSLRSPRKLPLGAVWANTVQPRSRPARHSVLVLARSRSPTAIVINARCSTARCSDICSGAVSLSRNTSQRQNCRSAPPLRWLGP